MNEHPAAKRDQSRVVPKIPKMFGDSPAVVHRLKIGQAASTEVPNLKTRHRILVVEDDSKLRKTLKEELWPGFEVLEATTISEACTKVRLNPGLSLSILDLYFPKNEYDKYDKKEDFIDRDKKAGIELLRELHEREWLQFPVIIYTWDRINQTCQEDLKGLGASLVFSKTEVSPRQLSQIIRGIIARADELVYTQHLEASTAEIRQSIKDEISRYLPLHERTIHIIGEDSFPLIKGLGDYKGDIENQLLRFPYNENVFLMMKFRGSNNHIAKLIIKTLAEHDLRGVRADQSEWNITNDVYNPIAVLSCCKYGIALFDQPEEHQAYHPNVAYELGIMQHQGKECLILKHKSLPEVPFDIAKDIYEVYEGDFELRTKVKSWMRRVKTK